MPAKKKAQSGTEALDSALQKIQQKRGLAIGTVADVTRPMEVLSTGNIALDYVTGVSGLPRGRIFEFFGKQSTGKSTAALHVCASARKAGLVVAYFDYEKALDEPYMRALGLDPSDPGFIFSQPETLEDGMNALRDLLATGQLAVGVVDSVAAMVSQKQMEADSGEPGALGLKARLMSAELQKMTGLANKHGTILIFVNHEQDIIDTSPMGQRLAGQGVQRYTTPGGNALKFYASIRLRFTIIGKEHHDVDSQLAKTDKAVREPYANNVQVLVDKNKVGPPLRKAVLRLDYGKGFSQSWSVLNILVAQGRVKKKAAGYYDIPDPETGEIRTEHGEQSALRLIEGNLDAYATEAINLLEEATRPPTPEELAAYEAQQAEEDSRIAELLDA